MPSLFLQKSFVVASLSTQSDCSGMFGIVDQGFKALSLYEALEKFKEFVTIPPSTVLQSQPQLMKLNHVVLHSTAELPQCFTILPVSWITWVMRFSTGFMPKTWVLL